MGIKRTLYLTQEEKNELLKILNETEVNSISNRRAKAVLLKSEGKSLKEISREIGLTKQAVHNIVKLFEKNGLDAVLPKKRGKKEKFAEEKQQIINLVSEFAPFEFGIEKRYWTLRTIVKAMKKIYNVEISVGSVRKILQDNRINLKAIRNKYAKRKLSDYLKE
ncbi:MAG: helix-turn-helix domain-containing protein [Candidatus Kryptonium sp.]|nr:helix-turn-helix domain-containing protein [Candidatus Kryptonium sp.]MCX7763070.1 helix-turn-helix domain-containing protein [Candidatus Kryptonium sp.]